MLKKWAGDVLATVVVVVVVFFFPGPLLTPLLYNLYNLIRLLDVGEQSKYDIDIVTSSTNVARNSSRPSVICGISLLLVLVLPRGCFSGYSFLPPQKPTTPNSSSIRKEDVHENQLGLMW